MKTVLGLLAILGLSISIAVASYGWKPSQENIAPLETAAQVVFPTRTPIPTITQTPSPTPTNTPQPTATRTLFSQPTTDTTKIVEVAAANATAQALITQANRESQSVAWGWVWLAGAVVGMVIAVIAVVVAYVRSLRGDFGKAPQNDAQAARKAVETSGNTLPSNVPPCTITQFVVWYSLIDTSGKTPARDVCVPEIFKTRDEYYYFFEWLLARELVMKSDNLWYLAVESLDGKIAKPYFEAIQPLP